MSSLLKMANLLDVLPMRIGKAGGWLILPLIVIIMFDVIARKIDFLRIGMSELSWYWLIEPIKLQDMQWHLHGVLLLLSFGFGYLMNAHVRVDVLYRNFSPKAKAWVDLLGTLLLLFPMCGFIFFISLDFVSFSWQIQERSGEADGLPYVYLLKTIIPTMAGLLLFQGLVEILRNIAVITGQAEPNDEQGADLL